MADKPTIDESHAVARTWFTIMMVATVFFVGAVFVFII